MSGLDKIIGHISTEAESEAKSLLDAAKAQADSIRQDAEAKTAAECERIMKRSESEVQNILDRGNSSAELRKKQILLRKKQELINETIETAKAQLAALEPAAYFDVIKKLFAKNALGRDGEIAFSKKDLARLPEGFLQELSKAAAEKGGSLKLSEKPADIEGGFVLNYGGIEENCSFQALIDGNMEALQDKVQKELFA